MGKSKKVYKRIQLITMAIFLMFFFIYTGLTLITEGVSGNLDSITLISIVAIAISFPGIANTFAEELNPQKKVYKLSTQCPKCKHLIQMDMKEE